MEERAVKLGKGKQLYYMFPSNHYVSCRHKNPHERLPQMPPMPPYAYFPQSRSCRLPSILTPVGTAFHASHACCFTYPPLRLASHQIRAHAWVCACVSVG